MKKITLWSLAVASIVMLGSCQSQNQEMGTTDVVTPHVYTNPTGDEFPILAWFSLRPEEHLAENPLTKERYEEMAEAGFNISFSHFRSLDEVKQGLEASQGTGVKILVTCAELESDTENTVKQLRDHPQNVGYFLRDEPTCAGFPDLAAFAERIRRADDTKLLYLNLLPHVPPVHLQAESYTDYVARFIKEVKLGMVSFDHYPVVFNGVKPNYYANLEDIASEAKKAGVPFWAFSLATAHNDYPVANRAAMRMQIFSNLAYGAQGIQYFTYTTPMGTIWNFHNAPIDEKGQRTEVYDRIAEINHEVQSLSKVFLGAEVIKLRHTGENIPMGTTALTASDLPKQILKVEADGEGVLVSHLKNGNRQYLMIVNRDIYQPQRVTVETAEGVMRIMPDDRELTAKTYSPSLYVEAGDMLLFGWEQE